MNGEFCVAAHALVYLHHKGVPLSSEALAENICTHPVRVRRVLSRLRAAGLVASKEGEGGGYRFCGEAGAVTLLQVADALGIRCVELRWRSGSVDMECLVASGMGNLMEGLADDLDQRCRQRLAALTIADLEGCLFDGLKFERSSP